MSHPNEARLFRCPECGEDLTNRWPVLTCEDGCGAEFTVDDQGVWWGDEKADTQVPVEAPEGGTG